MRTHSDKTGRANRRPARSLALRWKRRREAGFVSAWKLEGMVAITLLGLFLAIAVPAYVTARKAGGSVLWSSSIGLAYGLGTLGALIAVIYIIVRLIAWRESRQSPPETSSTPNEDRLE